ncbi:MAG: HmuY family protein [Myxococcota bacterium]
MSHLLKGVALAAPLLLLGCPADSTDTDTDVPNEAVCTEPEAVECFDDLLIDLSLQDEVTTALITNDQQGPDWVSDVDATAGGFANAANNPWIYAKFTDAGLERVDVTDEEALESMEWHIAARRFVIRLNGGNSGPSCVSAAAFPNGDYDALTAADADGATFFEDDYYSSSCVLINDSSGLEGSPQVALSPWWSYPGCVATTDVPFLIQLPDGRMVKYRVQRYYGAQQNACNTNGTPGGDSGQFRWVWSFVN